MDISEDILFAYNLVKKVNPNINLYSELCLNEDFEKLKAFDSENQDIPYVDEDNNVAESQNNADDFKVKPNTEFTNVVSNLKGYDFNLSNIDSIAFDQNYIYCIHTSYGLVKIGKIDKEGIEKGKLYDHQTKWSGTKYTLLCLNSLLYLRPCVQQEENKLPSEAEQYSDHPFIILKTEALDEPINDQYLEIHKSTKRSIEKDTWNKPVLENINYKSVEEEVSKLDLEEYRVLLDIPLATEGKFIYAVAFYIKDIKNLDSGLTKIVVEKYCSITWKCLNEITLNLTLLEVEDNSRESESLRLHYAILINNLMNNPQSFFLFDVNAEGIVS